MNISSRRFIAMSALAIVVGYPSWSSGADWFDDFNDGNVADGNPVTWNANTSGFLPGTQDAASGDYQFSALGDDSDNSSLEASVNMTFTDTYVRTQAVVLPNPDTQEPGGTLGVWARFDPAQVTGYLALLSTGGHMELLRLDPGFAISTLGEVDNLEVNTLEDAMIELNVVDDLLSVFVWRPSDPKPAEPVFSINDSEYASGRAGILHNENDDGTIGVFRFAAAQDTPFPEPTAGDFDNDGDVDGADFMLGQRDSFNTLSLADFKANFGEGGSISAVPEPATWALVVMGTLAAGYVRRRASR